MSATRPAHAARVVRLADVDELFTVAPSDPFTTGGRTEPGIEEIVRWLRSRRLRAAPRTTLTLVLPQRSITADLPDRVRSALDRYATAAIERARADKQVVLHEGRSKLRSELILAPVAALLVALVLALTPGLPEPLLHFLTPIVTIAVWVAVWNPVDSLLFDRWALNRTIDVHRHLRDADVAVVAAEERDVS